MPKEICTSNQKYLGSKMENNLKAILKKLEELSIENKEIKAYVSHIKTELAAIKDSTINTVWYGKGTIIQENIFFSFPHCKYL